MVAVCAVAGVVPAVRGAGGAGVVGDGQQRVHVGVRRADRVSGAGDGPDDGHPGAGDFVAGGRERCRAGGGAAAGLESARRAAAHRYRRVQLSQAASLLDPRPSITTPGGWCGAGKGRSAETLDAFFDLLGPSGCARVALVTADLAASWQKALRARVPHARVVFDRFHVERLASDAVDEVRRAEQRRVGAKAAKTLKGTRFCLLKHPARLKPGEKRRLEKLRRENRALDRAYELKEYLATILERVKPDEAPDLLDEWLAWAARSRLGPFVKLARTVRKHATGILAYLDTKMTNGVVEGINNKLRVIARRAYGFHSHNALISMLFLCCGGIELVPHLPTRV